MTVENVTTTKKVFFWTGQVAHLVDTAAPLGPDDVPERAPALCRKKPFWPGVWYDEPEILNTMPVCGICNKIQGALVGDNSA